MTRQANYHDVMCRYILSSTETYTNNIGVAKGACALKMSSISCHFVL